MNIKDYDLYEKIVLSYKFPFAYILKTLIPAFSELSIKEIIDYYLLDPKYSDYDRITREAEEVTRQNLGNRRFDLKITLNTPEGTIGVIVNLEIQRDSSHVAELKNRVQYNMASALAEQKADYLNLKKVYSVWIHLFPAQKRFNTCETYASYSAPYLLFQKDQEPRTDFDRADFEFPGLMQAIIVNVGEPGTPGFNKFFEFLYDIEKSGGYENFFVTLKEKYGWDLTGEEREQMQELLDINNGWIAQGKEEGIAIGKEEGLALGKEEGLALGKEEGLALGKEEGIAIGKEEGLLQGQVGLLKNYLNYSKEQVLEYLVEHLKMSRDEAEAALEKYWS